MMVMIIICIPYEKGRWGGNLMTRVGVDLKTEGGALHR